MRLFIAIDLPPSIKGYLRKLQSLLHRLDGTEMSFTRDFHVTLKFLGSCGPGRRKEIEKRLGELSTAFKPFNAHLTQIGSFGGQHPRIVWVGITSPSWLKNFARSIGNEDDFVPHITLARIKAAANPKEFLEDAGSISIEPMKFNVEDFCLFESRLSPKGAVHIKLNTFPRQRQ